MKTNHFWLSDTPNVASKGWDEKYNCYCMCVHAKLREKATGKIINFMNTHFGNAGQVKSVNLIKDYCDKFSDEPVCIVGDFNMQPDSKGYFEMTKYFTDVNAVTAKDWQNTYHGYNPKNPEVEHIDYCFANDCIAPHTRTLIADTIDGKFPSDHFGLIMSLS